MNERILVVDDLQTNRKVLVELFDKEYEVVEAADVATALDAFGAGFHENNPFSLIITDYQMPGGNGLELIEMIRRCDDKLPIILYSSYVASAKEPLPVNVTFLEKPTRLVELKQLVDRLISAAAPQAK